MPTVEGFTPGVLWTTIYGLVALCLLFMIGYRVYDAVHTIQTRRKEKSQAKEPDFADKVGQKVLEKLEPRFKEIEQNLAKDKSRLDNHELVISSIKEGQRSTKDGLTAICKFMLVIGTYGEFGDNEKVKEANLELQKYLTEKL